MTNTERAGLGVSAVAHLALFAVLSLGWLATPKPVVVPQAPIDVSLVDEIDLQAAAPAAPVEEPAPSVAPEVAPPEPAPVPKPAPPVAETPPPPVPVAKPQPKPQPAAKPAPAKPAPTKPVVASKPVAPPRGSRLGADFLKGISDRPTTGTSETPRAAKIGAREVAGLADAIRRQVQPCADRITSPGPGSNVISTKLNLRLNSDGSFAARPQVVSQSGLNDENSRYARRVGELATAAFVQCAPFDLPAELYDGWKNFNLNYKLPD